MDQKRFDSLMADIRFERLRRAVDEVKRRRQDADEYQRAQDGTFGSGEGIRGPAKPALQKGERAEHIKPEKEALKAALAAHAQDASPANARAVRDARNALKEKRAVAGSSNPDQRAAEPKDRRAHADKEADDKRDLRSADPEVRGAAEDRMLDRTPKGAARARQATEFFEENTSEKQLSHQMKEIHSDTAVMAEGDFWSAKGEFKEKAWASHAKRQLTSSADVNELDVLKERLGVSGIKAADARTVVQQAKFDYTERVKKALEIKPSEGQIAAARALHEKTYGAAKEKAAKAPAAEKTAPVQKAAEPTKVETAHSSTDSTPEGTTPGVERLPSATLTGNTPQQIAEQHLPRMISDSGAPYDGVWVSDYMKATGTAKADMNKMWADGTLQIGSLDMVQAFSKQSAKVSASELSRNRGDTVAHVIRVKGKRT